MTNTVKPQLYSIPGGRVDEPREAVRPARGVKVHTTLPPAPDLSHIPAEIKATLLESLHANFEDYAVHFMDNMAQWSLSADDEAARQAGSFIIQAFAYWITSQLDSDEDL